MKILKHLVKNVLNRAPPNWAPSLSVAESEHHKWFISYSYLMNASTLYNWIWILPSCTCQNFPILYNTHFKTQNIPTYLVSIIRIRLRTCCIFTKQKKLMLNKILDFHRFIIFSNMFTKHSVRLNRDLAFFTNKKQI